MTRQVELTMSVRDAKPEVAWVSVIVLDQVNAAFEEYADKLIRPVKEIRHVASNHRFTCSIRYHRHRLRCHRFN